MNLGSLKCAAGRQKARKRVGRGRGSGVGKTCGRGHKGQKARSGYSRRIGFEGGQMPLHRRLPKRGFRHEARFPRAAVNVDALERTFDAGAEVTPEAMIQAGLVAAAKGGVKVLGRGEVTKKLTVKTHAISDSARKKIEAAGGSIEIIQVWPCETRSPAVAGKRAAEDL
ncbi:MAG TPA: 50S ribosomal protein L15 [Candidatus Hydrogenedentes bacterium]|nr:50S ribosomal protein L15 [Candidatus Hydrogenedentota bacterium]HIJ73787.1 50S ribosomal protein L15 [Candidatus Hydrogenedentota bacterium]